MTIIGVKIDKKFMRDLLILILGVGLYVLSVQLFVIPNRLASNGVAGFSVLMDFLFGKCTTFHFRRTFASAENFTTEHSWSACHEWLVNDL